MWKSPWSCCFARMPLQPIPEDSRTTGDVCGDDAPMASMKANKKVQNHLPGPEKDAFWWGSRYIPKHLHKASSLGALGRQNRVLRDKIPVSWGIVLKKCRLTKPNISSLHRLFDAVLVFFLWAKIFVFAAPSP